MNQSWNSYDTSSRKENTETARILQALEKFANAPNWEQTRQLLQKRRTELLSDFALSVVRLMIADYESSGNTEEAENWRMHLHLLEDARKRGISKAWKCFITQQYEAAVAHDALVRAATLEELYTVLNKQQTALLTDAAMVMLRETIAQEYATHNFEVAAHLDRLLELLIDARTYGVAIAWDRFKRSTR